MKEMIKNNLLYVVTVLLIPVAIWSGYKPKGYLLWFAESLPVWIGVGAALITYKQYRLTNFSYFFIFIGAILVLIGAHYSYSAVPIGEYFKEYFGWGRNNYDKIGHFFQGFISTMIMKEILYKKIEIPKKFWIDFFSVNFAMSFAALWEIAEWFEAVTMIYFGSQKPALQFMGAQGYVWDTQSDMFFAFCGGITVVLLKKYHERFISFSTNDQDRH